MTDCHTILIQFYLVKLQMLADRLNGVVRCCVLYKHFGYEKEK